MIEGLTWGDYTEELFDIGSSELDFIIGSDLFFDPEVFEPLLITISYLLEQKPDTGPFLSEYVFVNTLAQRLQQCEFRDQIFI